MFTFPQTGFTAEKRYQTEAGESSQKEGNARDSTVRDESPEKALGTVSAGCSTVWIHRTAIKDS